MYLEHFKMKQFPFTLTPNTEFYCDLPDSQRALNVLLFGLRSGEGFIKIIGEVGTGKTLLCRKLLNSLDKNYVTAYVPNPDLSSTELRHALAQELRIEVPSRIADKDLLALITTQLLKLRNENKKVILVIDEAQALPDETLEALRLLTNLETESEKLLQVILFAQPELDTRLKRYQFRQLKQRITFSYYLQPIKRKQLNDYLCHRLAVAGYTKSSLFSRRAINLLYRSSRGLPRVINVLCHKALLSAYGKGATRVGYKAMQRAVQDTDVTLFKGKKRQYVTLLISLGLLAAILIYQFHAGEWPL